MNFLDTYDVAGSTTPTQEPEQSFNEEVSQVIGQLGRFWGGFRKQSQTVLETARKDLTEVVHQAQREITKLTADPEAVSTADGETEATPASSDSVPDDNSSGSTSLTLPTSSLLSRLQSVLPPNLLETARNQIPESLKHASENIDLPQLRANFFSEFQRVQGVTRAQAEEYAHKSEALFRDAVKEASEVLRDAVKILPPEESGSGASGLVWDGSDMWSLPLEPSDTPFFTNPTISESTARRRYVEAQDAVATRVESLFRRLKHDPSIVRHDPTVEGGELYSSWIAAEVVSKEGGIEGEYWTMKIATALDEPASGDFLKATKDALVPSELTESEFWTRFFFRTHQIENEEQKRKSLLEGALEEEDFSWEDDDDEAGTSEPTTTSQSASVVTSTSLDPQASKVLVEVEGRLHALSAASSTGARDSGDEYDVVSSGNVSPRVENKPVILPTEIKDGSDADSDWE